MPESAVAAPVPVGYKVALSRAPGEEKEVLFVAVKKPAKKAAKPAAKKAPAKKAPAAKKPVAKKPAPAKKPAAKSNGVAKTVAKAAKGAVKTARGAVNLRAQRLNHIRMQNFGWLCV